MAKKVGKDCKLYRCATALDDESNTPALATWLEMTNVRDVNLPIEVGEADVSTRATSWRQVLPTLMDAGITFQMMWDSDDAGMVAVRDACLNRTEIAMAVMDDDIEATAEGLASNFSVFGFSRNEPLEEGVTVDITIKPSSYTEWYEAAGS